jgi:hypothetical protein
MDKLENYRQVIQKVLTEYAQIPYAHGDIQLQTVFDRENDHYLLLLVGREGARRVHGCLIHVDIINDKLWIQRDGTEHGVADDFVQAGIPKSQIVLGFRSASVRQYTEFATA